MKDKRQFEIELEKHNIKVHSCRANNGLFAEKTFRDEMQKCHQLITFWGVGSHRQNGSIEQCIEKITTRDRVMLLHAKRYCPEAITHILWPLAVAEATHMENHFSIDEQGHTPLQQLTATDVPIKLRDYHV